MIHKPYQLPYSFSDLEPYIDTKTMEIHYGKHYQTYHANLNTIVEKYTQLQKDKIEDLLENLEQLDMPDKDKVFFKNNAGGYLNHNLYWQIMGSKKEINDDLTEKIKKTFGSLDTFKQELSQKALTHFGSGWAWLVQSKGILKTYSLPNQDSPYLQSDIPLIGLDVWEHAYYLKYQNRRAEYIENWWKAVKII